MATIGKDGMPSQSVVWFDLDPDEDVVILNTLAGRLKHRHLQRDPRVSLCFEDREHYLTITGRAELSPDPGMGTIWAMARRYGEGDGSFAKGERINIRVRVERVIWHP
jgi:PPOX class probable F420-dependent enzyme